MNTNVIYKEINVSKPCCQGVGIRREIHPNESIMGENKLTWVWRQDHEIFREKQRLERNEIPKEVCATAVMSWRHEMNQLRESISQLVDYTRSAGSYCHNKKPNLT